MDQERKHLQSTKPKPVSTAKIKEPTECDSDEASAKWTPPVRTNKVICAVTPATDKIYSDLTGQFPVQSSLGNKYILIMYHYDANAIIAEPLKDRTAQSIANAHEKVYDYLTNRGLKPLFEVLDNECSKTLIAVMTKRNISFQLVPPHLHRANAAERAIRTWKNHFIAILCGLNPRIPGPPPRSNKLNSQPSATVET